MDSISPDCDVRWCYLVVFTLGVISAWAQVYKRLVNLKVDIRQAALVPSTWLLCGIYLAMPVLLFWLMDRVGALTDTSLFSALLVGVAYPAILEGGFGGLKAPTSVGDIAKPIMAFTDKLIDAINKGIAAREERFEDFVVKEMVARDDLFQKLLGDVKSSGLKIDDLQPKLDEIDKNSSWDALQKKERKARVIYLYLPSVPGALDRLKQDKTVLGTRLSQGQKTAIAAVVAALVVIGIIVASVFELTRSENQIWLCVWRMGKPNSTEIDRDRARAYLRTCLLSTNLGPATYRSLAQLIYKPNLPAARVDGCLQLLLQARGQIYHQEIMCAELIDALRVGNADARAHVHQALLLLATKQDPSFKEKQRELAAWNPTTEGSIITVELWIERWRQYFCHPQPAQDLMEKVNAPATAPGTNMPLDSGKTHI